MSRQQQATVTATFRQNLTGQLIWLDTAPVWAVPAIYAERIHPLIVDEIRNGSTTQFRDAASFLIGWLKTSEPQNAAQFIREWLGKQDAIE